MTDINKLYPKDRITLREVGLRDGLQMVTQYPSTAGKQEWMKQEYASGIRHFELGSYLPKDRYPMFADIDDLTATIDALPGAHAAALVPNLRGAKNGFASGVAELQCVVSASEAHNEANLNCSQETTLRQIGDIVAQRDAMENGPIIGVGLAMSFGCSISGHVAPKSVLDLAEKCYAMGIDIVSIADTVGYAGPHQVAHLTTEMQRLAGDKHFGVHLHDTRGMGLANAAAAMGQGARVLDASLGGLGGCPAALNATGNIVMEDLVFLCETSGFETGVDLEALISVRRILDREMPQEPLYGSLAKAGLPKAYPYSAEPQNT
ncbi:hydroxymethylglutaryl-CoA lyase [Cohaesibacter celericrescens]|uniref:hydroxymethylglutaryl-CoA lyase n=1 Tax=Cohaesibacter celericrescens TaxID=2067669 RepID=UPI00356612FC